VRRSEKKKTCRRGKGNRKTGQLVTQPAKEYRKEPKHGLLLGSIRKTSCKEGRDSSPEKNLGVGIFKGKVSYKSQDGRRGEYG